MTDYPSTPGFRQRRRAARRVRALDKQALREEFHVDRPRGLARLRAYAKGVEDLEMARMHAHLWVGRPRPAQTAETAPTPASASARRRAAPR